MGINLLGRPLPTHFSAQLFVLDKDNILYQLLLAALAPRQEGPRRDAVTRTSLNTNPLMYATHKFTT